MGIPSLKCTAFKKMRTRNEKCCRSIAKRTCQRCAEEEKELTKQGNHASMENETFDVVEEGQGI